MLGFLYLIYTSKMKKISFLIFLLCSSFAFSQNKQTSSNKGVLSGIVVDKVSKEALPYVNIIAKDASQKIITGGITNDKGEFSISRIPLGTYFIEIQYIGYKLLTKQVVFNNKQLHVNLQTIQLTEDTTALEDVIVRAETSTVVQKIDRKVINVGKDLTAAGTTASELLNNVQSVSVDSQTGNISLRGNENVRILVDGKPTNVSAAQLLQQIPSSSIKSIELITNPSAKYNPEGMSGIINIILQKNAKKGFNGSINTGLTYGKNLRYNGSLDMNYKKGKVNFFTNYGFNTGKSDMWGAVNVLSNDPRKQIISFDRNNTNQLIKFGADMYFNDKNTLSVYSTQNFSDNTSLGDSKVFLNTTLITDAPRNSERTNASETYNLNYKTTFNKKGHDLEFEINYSKNKAPEDIINQNTLSAIGDMDYYLSNYYNYIKNNRKNTLINLDYTNPIGKGKLEIGAEIRVNKTNNSNLSNQERFIYDSSNNVIGTAPLGNTSFDYNRDIYSSYINYGYKFEKITMQLGARLEQYNVNANFINGTLNAPYKDNIFSIYPSAFFTFIPSEKNQYQLSFSRRVDRPSTRQVNPNPRWSTPLVTAIGNPNLKPQFTNSIEINYTRALKKGSITFGSFYRHITDEISRNGYLDPTDADGIRQIRSYTNFDNTNRYGLEFSTNYKLAKWWRVNASVDFYSQQERNLSKSITANALNARISNSFTASKKLRFQLFTMFRGAKKGIQFNRAAMFMVNTGASLSVLKRKGTISFRFNDIFKGMRYRYDATDPIIQNGNFNWESRTAYLGFMYRFGGGKNKARQRKKRDGDKDRDGGGFM